MFTVNGIDFRVLRKKELRSLLRVKTNKKQARQIKKRNEELLDKLNSLPTMKQAKAEYTCPYDLFDAYELEMGVDIACPHCTPNLPCESCAWMHAAPFSEIPIRLSRNETLPCLGFWFGGVTARKCSSIELSNDGAFVDVADLYGKHRPVEEFAINETFLDRRKKCRLFLKGHIEWANAIIAGIKPEDV